MKKFPPMILLSILLLSFSLAACDHSGDALSEDLSAAGSSQPVSKSIHGAVQKGPYLNGTSLTFFELSETLGQTGKSYNAQIKSNSGDYELKDISFTSNFVMIKADGFYFNEVSGKVSEAPLSLYAISDIRDKSTINVNLMSHLEKDRIEYLMDGGAEFSDAKKQAQQEILNIFSISLSDIAESELLTITEAGDGNAALLAISLILQGFRTTAELSELLANIATDIRTDGVLDSAELGTKLVNDIGRINLEGVRENIEARYEEIGLQVTPPEFEGYIRTFLDNTGFVPTANIIYDEAGLYGDNLLGSKTDFMVDNELGVYSIEALVPVNSLLEIRIILPDPDFGPKFGRNVEEAWEVSQFFEDGNLQIRMTTTLTNTKCDIESKLYIHPGTYNIEIFENGARTPTRTKVITVRSRTRSNNLPGWAMPATPTAAPTLRPTMPVMPTMIPISSAAVSETGLSPTP
ncbi:MAG: hypothetical protein ACYC5K_02795 [Saccharofermentanales bacterium]